MLKQLKYFQSVVRLGSFSAVAEENFISQSAISQQVQSLEHELGFALLVRKNRSFSLTPAGEYFYRKSLLLTADCKRMCAEAAKIAKGEAVSLKIGYLRTYAGGEFHRALAAFSAKYPDVSVSVEYGSHINEVIGADTLGYLSNEHVVQLAKNAKCGFCTACFTGEYAVEPESVLSTDIHDRHLNDRPKDAKKLGE